MNNMQDQSKKIIYDLGSNVGNNITYYLKKADMVVAVEANPVLCRIIEQRYDSFIQAGRLIVENRVLTTNESNEPVYFYLHKKQHEYGQFPEPDQHKIHEYEKVLLESISVTSLIKKYGDPFYIKIDIEYFDQEILRALFENNIHPPFISAESHSIHVFSLFVSLGGYKSFKLVDGESVAKKFKNHPIVTSEGGDIYSFPYGSAGPFGEDIPGAWMSADNFFVLLAYEKLGWKDIHATNVIEPDVDCRPVFKTYIYKEIRKKLNPFIPKPLRPIIWGKTD